METEVVVRPSSSAHDSCTGGAAGGGGEAVTIPRYRCDNHIYNSRGGFRICGKPAVVTRGFRRYCRECDPERPEQMTLSERAKEGKAK